MKPRDEPEAPRKRYHHGQLRAALIQAGLEILREQGLADLTLRAIAARAGVSHAAPRNHFPSHRALLSAIAAEGFRLHAAAMREGLGSQPTRQERLRAACAGYVAFAEREPQLFALMFSPVHSDPDDPALKAAGAESYAVLRGVAEGLVWPGAEGPNRAERTEAMLWSFVHGFATLREAGHLDWAPGAPGELAPAAAAALSIMPVFNYEE